MSDKTDDISAKAAENASAESTYPEGIKPDVLSYDDVCEKVPFFRGKPKLVNALFKFLAIDKVNKIHRDNCATPGAPFVAGLLKDLEIKLKIDNEERLDNLPKGAFITVSNHPFGALDGITLIHLVAQRRPTYKVMVNMILNYITAMRPNFIAVDAYASSDPQKQAVSKLGITEVIRQVRNGEPIGFFPAGAVAQMNWKNFTLKEREWQPNVIRLIQKLNVPVVPIYFHGRNSMLSYVLSAIWWPLRSLRLPAEVFRRKGDTLHITVGETISAEEQKACATLDELKELLQKRTFGK